MKKEKTEYQLAAERAVLARLEKEPGISLKKLYFETYPAAGDEGVTKKNVRRSLATLRDEKIGLYNSNHVPFSRPSIRVAVVALSEERKIELTTREKNDFRETYEDRTLVYPAHYLAQRKEASESGWAHMRLIGQGYNPTHTR